MTNLTNTVNTVRWVDEGYARRLARQTVASVRAATQERIHDVWIDLRTLSLQSMRASPLYVSERPIRYGFGVKKRGSRVYLLDRDTDTNEMGICRWDYDACGRLILDTYRCVFTVGKHPLERLYERLRTNAFGDVRIVIEQLVQIQLPDVIGSVSRVECEAQVVGVGTFCLVAELIRTLDSEPYWIWVAKTFIAEKAYRPPAQPARQQR